MTALNPIIGYKAATRIAKNALDTGKSIRDIVLEEGLMDKEWLDYVLSPQRMTRAGFLERKKTVITDDKKDGS